MPARSGRKKSLRNPIKLQVVQRRRSKKIIPAQAPDMVKRESRRKDLDIGVSCPLHKFQWHLICIILGVSLNRV